MITSAPIFSPVLQGGVKLKQVNSFGGIFESAAKNHDKTEVLDKQFVAKL